MIHLPQTGHEVLGPELQRSNIQTIKSTDKTFEYRSFRPILSLLKQKLKFQVNYIRNGGLGPPQCSPMGPNFFLTWNRYIYICWCLGIWTGKVVFESLKTGKPGVLRRIWVRVINILIFGDLEVYINCPEVERRIKIWLRVLLYRLTLLEIGSICFI